MNADQFQQIPAKHSEIVPGLRQIPSQRRTAAGEIPSGPVWFTSEFPQKTTPLPRHGKIPRTEEGRISFFTDPGLFGGLSLELDPLAVQIDVQEVALDGVGI